MNKVKSDNLNSVIKAHNKWRSQFKDEIKSEYRAVEYEWRNKDRNEVYCILLKMLFDSYKRISQYFQIAKKVNLPNDILGAILDVKWVINNSIRKIDDFCLTEQMKIIAKNRENEPYIANIGRELDEDESELIDEMGAKHS